jgi:hypothetical protein
MTRLPVDQTSALLVSPSDANLRQPVTTYPPGGSRTHFAPFFEAIHRQDDLGLVYGASDLRSATRRVGWDPTSPSLPDRRVVSMTPRIGEGKAAEGEAEPAPPPSGDAEQPG